MMHWVLFSVVAAGLFWGFYRLLLRRDGWLQLSRFYLIISLVFSLVYPLVPLPELSLPLPERMGLTAAGVGAGGVLPAVEVADASRPAADAARRIPTMIYLAGVALSLAVLAVQLARTLRMVRRGKPVDVDGRRGTPRLYKAEGAASSFSFFNHIVVESGDMSDDERQCILAHEREHVRLHHTEDVLLMRLLCCVAWFNPFAWLMLGELRAVHERQADAAVLSRCAKEDYLRLLYRQATGFGYGHITHNFNSINLKKRIVMMNKTKSRFGAWKPLAALPLVVVLMMVGCRTANAEPAGVQTGEGLLTVTYHRTGGKPLPFGGIGYNSIHSQWNPTLQEVRVDCKGEGAEHSYGAWEIDPLQTSKGMVDGQVLSRNEKKVIQAVDRELRRGHSSGTLDRTTTVKTDNGDVTLCFAAAWQDGTRQGDAVIKLWVVEVDAAKEPVQTVMEQSDEVYQVVEETPEYPGGTEAMYKFLRDNIHYPAKAKEEGVEGRVYVAFVVEADGRLSDIKVLRGIGGGCDEEAVRVVEAMPRWKPGRHHDKAVRVQYYLPIVFKLS